MSIENSNSITFKLYELIELFQSTPESEKYFSSYIQKFKNISERLKNSKVEIGVIGITSSGKSTLLNAILGAKILPQKVKPSSGVQIVCEYGEIMKAIIFFKAGSGKSKKTLTANICKMLERYACESKNPNNKLQVDEIRFFSPKFRLSRNIVLVDTPGLDAYGLENHEKITLQLVIPSVQMIMFLTTVKGSSDQTNLSLIDQITSENKPLLVVQNMIDSIVPKESQRGIEKTCEEVQAEHLKRISKLLQKAQNKSVQFAPVVQISALKAISDWKGSGMETFVQTLNQLVEHSNQDRSNLFVKQITNELSEIKNSLKNNKRNLEFHHENNNKIALMRKHLNDCKNDIENCKNNIYKENEVLINKAKDIITNIINKYSNRDNPKYLDPDIKKSIDDILSKMKNITHLFSEDIQRIQKRLTDSCKELNLQNHDIIKRQRLEYFCSEVPIPIESKKHKKKENVKQQGIWGKFLRSISFGSLGYEDKEYEISEDYVNIRKLSADFAKKIEQWNTFIQTSIESFSDNSTYSLDIMKNDLETKEKNENKRLLMIIDDELRKKIITQITKFTKEVSGTKTNEENTVCSAPQRPLEVEDKFNKQYCSKLAVNLFYLAHYESFKPLYSLRDRIIEKNGNHPNVVIWGWDTYHLNRFVDCFFSDNLKNGIDDNENVKIYKTNNAIFSSLTLINENDSDEQNKWCIPDNSIFFLLLNSTQSGSSETKLRRSRFLKFQSPSVVWVMDSITDLIAENNDRLIEGFGEFIRLIHSSTGRKASSIMVSDRDLYYTVLLHELYFNSSNWTKRQEQQFVKDIGDCFYLNNNKRNQTGEYVRLFKMLNIQ